MFHTIIICYNVPACTYFLNFRTEKMYEALLKLLSVFLLIIGIFHKSAFHYEML